MSHDLDTLSRFRHNKSLLLHHNATWLAGIGWCTIFFDDDFFITKLRPVIIGEAVHTNFKVFGLTNPGVVTSLWFDQPGGRTNKLPQASTLTITSLMRNKAIGTTNIDNTQSNVLVCSKLTCCLIVAVDIVLLPMSSYCRCRLIACLVLFSVSSYCKRSSYRRCLLFVIYI